MTVGSEKPLYLFFPQWQGATTPEIYHSAVQLYYGVRDRADFTVIEVPEVQDLPVEDGIIGLAALRSQLAAATQFVRAKNPERIWTIGGDCGLEIVPVGLLNARYQGDLAVIWLDGHGDLNTAESSPSKTFQGMPLRVLLGEGDAQIVDLVPRKLQSKQVFLAGVRDLDPPEAVYIEQQKLTRFMPDQIHRDPGLLIDAIKQAGFTNVYIHLDLDVLDPMEFPYLSFPTPNGPSIEDITRLLDAARNNFNTVGFSILELEAQDQSPLVLLKPILERFIEGR